MRDADEALCETVNPVGYSSVQIWVEALLTGQASYGGK